MSLVPEVPSLAGGVLFLCSGNMIRSAFAELYARHLGIAVPVRSAGTTYSNPRLHPETRRALLARGVEARLLDSFRPRLLSELLPPPAEAEVVVGMTRAHLAQAMDQGAPGPRVRLTELVGLEGEIADPYFEGGFEGVFEVLATCVQVLAGREQPDA